MLQRIVISASCAFLCIFAYYKCTILCRLECIPNLSYICGRRHFEYYSLIFRSFQAFFFEELPASKIAPSTGEIADALIEMEQRIKRQQTALRPGIVWRHWGVKTQGRLGAMVGFNINDHWSPKSDSLRGRGSSKDRWNQMRGVQCLILFQTSHITPPAVWISLGSQALCWPVTPMCQQDAKALDQIDVVFSISAKHRHVTIEWWSVT